LRTAITEENHFKPQRKEMHSEKPQTGKFKLPEYIKPLIRLLTGGMINES
jgi:hypothetical protein